MQLANRKERRQARDTYDILAAILKICEESSRRSHLIYRANLTYNMLQVYLEVAIPAGLLKEEGKPRSLTTTPKGKIFLEEYRALKHLIEDEPLMNENEVCYERIRF